MKFTANIKTWIETKNGHGLGSTIWNGCHFFVFANEKLLLLFSVKFVNIKIKIHSYTYKNISYMRLDKREKKK